jgi:hypothetical protein
MKRKVHHQGYKSRLDESLGERHRGHHHQSLGSRRHESEAMERHYRHGHHPFAGASSMDGHQGYHHHMAHAHHSYLADHHKKRIHHHKKSHHKK